MQNVLKQRTLKTGLTGLFLFVVTTFVNADITGGTNDPKLLFEKMLAGRSEVLYQGSIVYEGSGQLLSYSVNSAYPETPGLQVLKTLSGPQKTYEFLNQPECFSIVPSLDQLSGWYNFSYIGASRDAGRTAHAIALRPVDPYRLGYNFVVDQETGLMLRSTLMLGDRRVLERLQFVDVSIYSSPDETGLETGVGNQLQQHNRRDCQITESSTEWSLDWIPEGFSMVKQTRETDKESFLYSDGLSSFSLFFEPVSRLEIPAGAAQRGATTLLIKYYASSGQAYMITFVGEVPPMTAERVMAGLRKSG